MLFGDKSKFAIEIEPKECVDDWIFGLFFIWINGIRFGDQDDSVDLKGCVYWAKKFLNSKSNLVNQEYYDMPLKEIGLEISNLSDISSKDIKYHIDCIGMSSFDKNKDVFVLIKNTEGKERLIFKNIIYDLNELYLGDGKIETVIENMLSNCGINV